MDLEQTRFAVEIALAVLATPFAIVLWFLLRKLISDVAKLEKALADIQLHAANTYVQKDDFNKMAEAIFKKLDRIEDFARDHILQGRNTSGNG